MKRKKLLSCNVDLPVELVTEVLARLPVKSLLRFRCVCKSWLSLISAPDFASLHLARYHDNNGDDNAFILISHVLDHTWMLRSAHNFRKVTSRYLKNLHWDDSKCCDDYCPWGSSVNGLLLLFHSGYRVSGPRPTNMMLWNPIIGKTHKLPTLWIHPLPAFGLGLGFHPSINDYKVVVLASPTIHVYSLSTRSWRSIVTDKQMVVHDMHFPGVLIEGTLFWVAEDYEKKSSLLVSFDVKDEVLDYITLPSADVFVQRHPVAYRKWVGLLDIDGLSCNLWVMEKDKVPGTWSKLYTVDLQVSTDPDIVCFKKNGDLIFATRKGGMKLCNIETQHMKHLMGSRPFYPKVSPPSYSTLYKESLVLI